MVRRRFFSAVSNHESLGPILRDAAKTPLLRMRRETCEQEQKLRPREFDHDDVLRVAFEQFWRKGVRGTSLSDIARDAGVQRGSLYNAFGSKEALFLCAY